MKAVVAGATGVVGRRLAEHLASTNQWEVVGLARRPANASFPTIAVDLTSAADCREKLGGLRDVTHIFYAARYPHTTQPEPIEINLAMMTDLVESIESGNRSLQHVHIVQGSKWYRIIDRRIQNAGPRRRCSAGRRPHVLLRAAGLAGCPGP